MYKAPIILFGIALPMAVAVVMIGCCLVVQSKLSKSFAEKEQKYQANDQNRKVAQAIEVQIGKQRPHLVRWSDDLSHETAGEFSKNLRLIENQLPSKEFQLTSSLERLGNDDGFSVVSAQNSSRVAVGFRGSFRTVQRAFLHLETRMPRLQLEQLTLSPAAGPVPQLNVQATYTSWEQ